MNKLSQRQRSFLGTVLLPCVLLVGCGGGGGGLMEGGDGSGPGDETPTGLTCSRDGGINTCAELQRIGGLTRSFAELGGLLYSARYSNALIAVMAGAPLPCPDGGTYSGTAGTGNRVTLTFLDCATAFGVVSGTAQVVSNGTNAVTTDDDDIDLDLAIRGTRYVGQFSAQHRRLSGREMFGFGLEAPGAMVTPAGQPARALSAIGGTFQEREDGRYEELGDLLIAFVDGGTSWQLQSDLSGSAALFQRTTTGGTSTFSTFATPVDGALQYLRSVPGSISLRGNLDLSSSHFTAAFTLLVGSGSASADATWVGVLAAPLYRGN